jgi:transcriptional regulator with XRE-family HTH domain
MCAETLGERIRRKRVEARIGLRQAARQVGVSATFLSRIETGAEQAPPSERVIAELAALLNDDFDELMGLAGRISAEVTSYVKSDPKMPEFLRQARERNMSAERLLTLLKEVKDDG